MGATMRLLFDDLPQVATPRPVPAETLAMRAWKAAVSVLVDQGGMSEKKARVFIGGLMKSGLRPEDLQSIAEGAQKAGTLDAVSYVAKAAHEAVSRRKTAIVIEMPSEARQKAWLQDWHENPAAWRRDVRGPAPGEAGCRIARSLLKEAGL